MQLPYKAGVLVLALILMGQGCPAPNAEVDTSMEADVTTGTMPAGSDMPDNGMVGGDAAVDGEGSLDADTNAPGDKMNMKDGSAVDTTAEADINVNVSLGLDISMKSGNFFFEPASIKASPGQTVTVNITENAGFHTFVIDEIGFKQTVKAGESFTFVAPSEPGNYAYYCDIGSHRALGMEGVLTVK